MKTTMEQKMTYEEFLKKIAKGTEHLPLAMGLHKAASGKIYIVVVL